MMIWTVKSKETRRKEYLTRVSEWHKKFLWLPEDISNQDGMRTWAWFQTVFRRAVVRDFIITDHRWEYCTDEFEMLKRSSQPSKPRYIGLNGWDNKPGS
jgi:hypothetical protein